MKFPIAVISPLFIWIALPCEGFQAPPLTGISEPAQISELPIQSDMISGPNAEENAKRGTGKVLVRPWPEGGVLQVKADSLPRDNNVPMWDDAASNEDNGRCVYTIKIQPKEKLIFNMASKDSKVVMRSFVPTPPPPFDWRIELQYSNKTLRTPRTKRLEIKNTTKTPQTYYLIVYGPVGYQYQIDMERKAL